MKIWNVYDRNGAYLGIAHGIDQESALEYARAEVGIAQADHVEERNETHEPHGR